LLLIAVLILLSGCSRDSGIDIPPEAESVPEFILSSELFVSEPAADGYTRTVFRTNDVSYWTHEGSTLWTVFGGEEVEFISRTVTVSKSSGFSGGGYGIVFCQGEHEVEGILKPAMLVVMVNNNGQYIIGKALGGVFSDFGWWQPSAFLNRGAGASNELSVIYDEILGKYRLLINGSNVDDFIDDDIPVLRGGKNGYIAVITPFDNFPVHSVNINYLERKD
jgi:hypothetical protein